MIILGIDPGSRVSGYALIQLEGSKFKYLASGVVKPDLSSDFFQRLPLFHSKFSEILQSFKIDHLAVESLIHVKNVVSLAKLSQARGAILSSVNSPSVKVFEYSPNKIKSSVSGFGHADKKMIHGAIEKILGQKVKCATHDESDALAVAIAHGIEVSNGGTFKKLGKSGLFSRKSGSLAASINPEKLKN